VTGLAPALSAPAAAGALLRLEDVEKSYRAGPISVAALRGVSLEVRAGELVALVGPSGSGKSTLLHLCGLVDRPDAGRCALDGQDAAGLSDAALARVRREKIGFVFQAFNLVPVLSARENVELPLLLLGVKRAERARRALAALEAVGLGPEAGRRPDRLSGGQRQRVAIARATAEQVVELLRALGRAQGAAVLVATHDARLTHHCDRTVALRDGVLA
jgi:putative ABC transport system ATP-binding protein